MRYTAEEKAVILRRAFAVVTLIVFAIAMILSVANHLYVRADDTEEGRIQRQTELRHSFRGKVLRPLLFSWGVVAIFFTYREVREWNRTH